jgi:hypothetical protein
MYSFFKKSPAFWGGCYTFAPGLKFPYGRTTEGSSQPDQIDPEHTTNHQSNEDDQCHEIAESAGSDSTDAALF